MVCREICFRARLQRGGTDCGIGAACSMSWGGANEIITGFLGIGNVCGKGSSDGMYNHRDDLWC